MSGEEGGGGETNDRRRRLRRCPAMEDLRQIQGEECFRLQAAFPGDIIIVGVIDGEEPAATTTTRQPVQRSFPYAELLGLVLNDRLPAFDQTLKYLEDTLTIRNQSKEHLIMFRVPPRLVEMKGLKFKSE